MDFYFAKFDFVDGYLTKKPDGLMIGLHGSREIEHENQSIQNGVDEAYIFDGFNCNFSAKIVQSFLKKYVKLRPDGKFIEVPMSEMPTINGEPIFRQNGVMIITNDYGIRLSDMSATPEFGHFERVMDENGQETAQFSLDSNGNKIIKTGYIGMYDFYYQQVISPIIFNSWRAEVTKRIVNSGNTVST